MSATGPIPDFSQNIALQELWLNINPLTGTFCYNRQCSYLTFPLQAKSPGLTTILLSRSSLCSITALPVSQLRSPVIVVNGVSIAGEISSFDQNTALKDLYLQNDQLIGPPTTITSDRSKYIRYRASSRLQPTYRSQTTRIGCEPVIRYAKYDHQRS